jgi:pimeloyl-ACP methyl ester carboxylesterase
MLAEAAAAAPQRVAALVLAGPTTDGRATGWPTLVARWLRTAVHERPGQVPRLCRDYARTGLGSMYRGMTAARRHRIEAVLPRVRCPVLVVRGHHDRIAPQDWPEQLAGIPATARATTLAAGGHMVPITHPALLATTVREFLAAQALLP